MEPGLQSRQLQLSLGGPAVAVYTQSLSADDVTGSKLEFGHRRMRLMGLRQEATFSSLGESSPVCHTVPASSVQPNPAQEGRTQERSIFPVTTLSFWELPSHRYEVGPQAGTHSLEGRLAETQRHKRGAGEMGQNTTLESAAR